MRIFLTGATGFIGGHTLQALCQQGHQVTCLVRTAAGRVGRADPCGRLSALPGVQVVLGNWTDPPSWQRHLSGHDAAINTIGIIREHRPATFQAVHTAAAIAFFQASTKDSH